MNKYLVKIAAKVSDTPKDPSYGRAIGRGFLTAIPAGWAGAAAGYGLTRNIHVARAGGLAGEVAGAVHGYKTSMKNQAKEEFLAKHR